MACNHRFLSVNNFKYDLIWWLTKLILLFPLDIWTYTNEPEIFKKINQYFLDWHIDHTPFNLFHQIHTSEIVYMCMYFLWFNVITVQYCTRFDFSDNFWRNTDFMNKNLTNQWKIVDPQWYLLILIIIRIIFKYNTIRKKAYT